jgi:hypothetical protein
MAASSLFQSVAAIGSLLVITAVRRAAIFLAGYLAAGLFLAVSLTFLTISAYRAIAGAIGDVYAGLLLGLAYLMASLITLLVLGIRRR